MRGGRGCRRPRPRPLSLWNWPRRSLRRAAGRGVHRSQRATGCARGDTVVKIMRRVWNDDDKQLMTMLLAANPKIAERRNRIFPGEVLIIPPLASSEDRAAAPVRTVANRQAAKTRDRWYVVRQQDTLVRIARRILGVRRALARDCGAEPTGRRGSDPGGAAAETSPSPWPIRSILLQNRCSVRRLWRTRYFEAFSTFYVGHGGSTLLFQQQGCEAAGRRRRHGVLGCRLASAGVSRRLPCILDWLARAGWGEGGRRCRPDRLAWYWRWYWRC